LIGGSLLAGALLLGVLLWVSTTLFPVSSPPPRAGGTAAPARGR
jgi:hypothetical protein